MVLAPSFPSSVTLPEKHETLAPSPMRGTKFRRTLTMLSAEQEGRLQQLRRSVDKMQEQVGKGLSLYTQRDYRLAVQALSDYVNNLRREGHSV